MIHNRILCTFVCAALVSQLDLFQPLYAQDLATRLVATDYRPVYDQTRTLGVDVHALAFFKNNEFGGNLAKGYTLPGFWLQPRLTWQPLDAVRLEAGFHAMVFNGAGKYPCFAYHDIAFWKGDQYQSGAHVLPFLRAQAQLKDFTFVLGNIYGGANHGLVEPMMNAEVNLTQDPEMGFQMFVDRPRYHLDAWINWQSFIFREDTHQEAFTVGLSQRISLNSKQAPLNWYVPIDILIQHRGGEIDATHTGVQTVDNTAVGLGLKVNARRKVLTGLTAELLALGCWQQTGELWPFDTGLGASASVSVELLRQVRLFATTFYAKDFIPLYGAPFFSTISEGQFESVLTHHVGAEWFHTFGKDYVLGAKLDTYLARTGVENLSGSRQRPAAFSNNFSFGIFMRCSPHFLIKRFK